MISQLISSPIFFIDFFTGLIFLITGIITLKFPPKEVNSLYGYRSKTSMENIEKWSFAQNYSSKEMIKLSIILISCSFISLIFNFSELFSVVVGILLVILLVVVLSIRTENALKK